LVEISDGESARAWLEGKPREVQVAFAARRALRALPSTGNRESRISGHIALPTLRAILTTGVAAVKPGPEVTAAAALIFSPNGSYMKGEYRSGDYDETEFARAATDSAAATDAYRASTGAFETAARAIAYTSRIVSYEHEVSKTGADVDTEDTIFPEDFTDAAADEASEAIEAAASYDAGILVKNAAPELAFNRRLWGNVGIPRWFEPARERLIDAWTSEPAVWGFWARWYQGMLDGEPLDWDLQRAVALIDDTVWIAGPEAVAERIRDIEKTFVEERRAANQAEFLVAKLPLAERVEFDFETARFRVVPIPVAKPDLLGTTLAQVADALDDALANPSNGLTERSRETQVLRRMLDRYGNDPQRIEMDLVSVVGSITRQVASDELPASEEILALHDACDQAARGVRATHPEVSENRRILSEQARRELPDEAKAQLREALPVLEAISDEALGDDWRADILTLVDDERGPARQAVPPVFNDAIGPVPNTAPRLPGADAATRVFSRAAKMSNLLKLAEIVHRIDGSAGYKALRIVATVASIVLIGIALIG
jgi:hypothetical protein